MRVFDKAHTDLEGLALHSSSYRSPDEAYQAVKRIWKRAGGKDSITVKIVRNPYNGLQGTTYSVYVETLYFS